MMDLDNGGMPSVEAKSSRTRPYLLLAAIIISFMVALAIGIGVGFAIGNGSVDDGEADRIIVIKQPDVRPTASKWKDIPCFQGDQPKCPKGVSSPPLILISLDGFRADFLNRGLTPVIKRLSECGVGTPYMIPSFPTLTFPNHYTIATGLYPESHGIIGNSMNDPEFEANFYLGGSESLKNRWWGGEPIWNTVEKQGKRAASYFWVGSDVDIQDIRPTYFFTYDGDNTYEQRVDVIRGWLSLPEDKRPDFITLYMDEPDHTGHDPGPDSEEENKMLERVDTIMERLMDSIVEVGMENCVNIIVIADHGMANRTCDQLYVLDDYIDKGDYYTRTTGGTMLRIDAKNDAVIQEPKEIVEALKCKHPATVPSLRQDIPKRWHYMNNRRIEDVMVPIEAGWTASAGQSSWCDGGTHGYDNLSPYMKALFLAYGPAFKQNIEVEPFQNIQLYNLMCEILGLDPAPNNGTVGYLHHLLNHPVPIQPVPPPKSMPEDCPYPNTDEKYNERIDQDMSDCTCNIEDATYRAVEDFDKELRMTGAEVLATKETHAPFGMPKVDFTGSSYCELAQSNYVTGYSHDLRMALFVSYTMEMRNNRGLPVDLANCTIRPDVRVAPGTSASCTDYDMLSGEMENVTIGYLYTTGLTDTIEDSMNARVTSNMVPQFPGFIEDIWKGLIEPHIPLWADEYNGINVITGPIFDYDLDGLKDDTDTTDNNGTTKFGNTLLPTHYFIVITRCEAGQEMNKNCNNLEPLAFILQNKDGIQTCQHPSAFVEMHTATIADVETLTGLRMFPDVPQYDAMHLKHHQFIKGTLWEQWKYGL